MVTQIVLHHAPDIFIINVTFWKELTRNQSEKYISLNPNEKTQRNVFSLNLLKLWEILIRFQVYNDICQIYEHDFSSEEPLEC